MRKHLWILVIVFTLVLVKVAHNPQFSSANQPNDPNKPQSPITQPKDANTPPIPQPNEPNQVNIPKIPDSNTTAPKTEKIQPKPKENDPNQAVEKKAPENKPELTETQLKLKEEFTKIFSEYRNYKNNIDYAKLRRQRLYLKPITSLLATLPPQQYQKWSTPDKIAFWINTYNLHKLNVVTENYPIEGSRWLNAIWGQTSIRHIKPKIDEYKFIVMNEEFTFEEIENRFFIEKFKEPKVFFALTMTTESSPHLRNEPYDGKNLQKQLDDQIKQFLADEKIGFKADQQNNTVYLSLILKPGWYGKLFIEKYNTDKLFKDQNDPAIKAVLNFIVNYLPPNHASYLKTGNYSVEYLKYNWLIKE